MEQHDQYEQDDTTDRARAGDDELPASEYPWDPPATSGLLTADGFTALPSRAAATLAGAPPGGRSAVVAVGSNAVPEVIRRKLVARAGPRTDRPSGHGGKEQLRVPFGRGTLHGVGVGHSAHVSVRGYFAAAPFAAPDRSTPVGIPWLDTAQLAAVDATEPNYRRQELDPARTPLVLDHGHEVPEYSVYASVHGVLSGPAGPLALMAQPDLHAWLRSHLPQLSALLTGTPAEVCDRLTDPGAREHVRSTLRRAGLVTDDTVPGR